MQTYKSLFLIYNAKTRLYSTLNPNTPLEPLLRVPRNQEWGLRSVFGPQHKFPQSRTQGRSEGLSKYAVNCHNKGHHQFTIIAWLNNQPKHIVAKQNFGACSLPRYFSYHLTGTILDLAAPPEGASDPKIWCLDTVSEATHEHFSFIVNT